MTSHQFGVPARVSQCTDVVMKSHTSEHTDPYPEDVIVNSELTGPHMPNGSTTCKIPQTSACNLQGLLLCSCVASTGKAGITFNFTTTQARLFSE